MLFGKKKHLIETGAKAPDFTLPLLAGGEAGLAQIISGKPALLAFFKIACPVCQLTLPFLQRLHDAGAIAVYGVSQNGSGDTRDFAQRYKLSLPIVLDPEKAFPASNAYGISSVPTLFLIESSGTIARVIEGWRKQDMASLGEIFSGRESVPEWKAG